MSTAHLALNYRPQGVTGDPLRTEGGQTWPQIAQLPRSVFTGWAVKFGLGAQLLSETDPLSIAPQCVQASKQAS